LASHLGGLAVGAPGSKCKPELGARLLGGPVNRTADAIKLDFLSNLGGVPLAYRSQLKLRYGDIISSHRRAAAMISSIHSL
jgi:hypothetical protein